MKEFAQLTYAGVLLAVFANQLCLPVPSVFFLMAAGALSARGANAREHHRLSGDRRLSRSGLDMVLVRTPMGFSGCESALPVKSRPARRREESARKVSSLRSPVLCVAKFFPGLDGLMPPLAGAEGVSLPLFLALDLLGGFLWSASYAGMGYLLVQPAGSCIPLG